MKFIHAGDIHLGNPFIGLDAQLPDNLKQLVQQSTHQAFMKMINDALTEKVDLLLLPGDFYSASESSPRLQELVQSAFLKLNQAGIQVFLSLGNHDFEANTSQHLPWPENVYIFDQYVETTYHTTASGEKIAVTGFSYQSQRQMTPVIDEFPTRDQAVDYHLGMYHGAVGVTGEPYAPFKVTDMLEKGYDYWALGHIHIRQTLNTRPFIGYSGSIQGLNRKEVGPKGYYIVDAANQLRPIFREAETILWDKLRLKSVKNEDDLQEMINHYGTGTQKNTFLSVELLNVQDQVLRARIDSGIVLEKIREHLPEQVWLVRLTIRDTELRAFPKDTIDQAYWLRALEDILTEFRVDDYLSDQVPLVLREYFMTHEGKELLKQKMVQQLNEGKG
ncbi:metallophosphoesterase family protein [Leuconostoc citreum]|uniref:metallophosphoesterase family protein n=1 Tax=Leuconostoc citreum TaxID=33964 RepID=UPI00024660BE|nr:metallophosphoesterase [Leuconostoc citreum]MCS8587820.1 DNA repair exonuclease [Leuconostoc citreum]MCS8595281.1 DNA repair exonuclease [Leuconostoc citreum]MCS8599263.1 DNA repair exonuclease [Leuconostoc citreum]CCF25514.1 DNA repair exonuclease [Leuconostoc citreum LBAE C10]